MSVPTVTVYIEDGHAHIINATGHGRIPASEVAALFTRADHSPSEFARWEDGRLYHRDSLRSALTLLDHADRCTFTSAAGDCDEPATFDPANPRPRCQLHTKDA